MALQGRHGVEGDEGFVDEAERLDIKSHAGESRMGENLGKLGKTRTRGQRGGPAAQVRDVSISKALSKLLRHAANDAGLELDKEGFARLDDVVSVPTSSGNEAMNERKMDEMEED